MTTTTDTDSSTTVFKLRTVLCNENENLALRFRALFSLKHLATQGDIEAIDAIASAFLSDSALLKHELAYCLGQSKNHHAATYLQSVLCNLNEDPMVRHEAAEALGALGHVDSLPLLRKFLGDEKPEVRETCEIAIERIEWLLSEESKKEVLEKSIFASIDPAPPLPTEPTTISDNSSVTTTVSKLQSALTDPTLSLFHRYRAMFRLRDLVSKHPNLCIPAIAAGFADPSALFRHEIAFVFGQLSHPLSVPYLIPVASNPNEHPMVRHEAVEALGSVGTEEVDEVLKMFAKDSERVVRESAVVALDMAEWERSGELEYALIPDKEGGKTEVAASA
ncbi:deoxyhypusine hydroxylase [Kalaharituber pfeilii]|nr:deoxyhypusine hydroxylase [Kalaharituber pfeilii]